MSQNERLIVVYHKSTSYDFSLPFYLVILINILFSEDRQMRFKRGYLWVTIGFFAITLSAHWVFAWFSYLQEQKEHNQPVEFSGYVNMTIRDTMENWQSEFLQLAWQVGGLAFLWAVASPQSKTESDRHEEKLDLIIQRLDPQNAKKILQELETKYPKK